MRKNMKKKLVGLVLTATLAMGAVLSPMESTPKAQAAKKAYCAKLKLNNNLKLNKTQTFVKTGVYQESTLFPKAQKIKVKYTVTSKRKSVGKNYKVTYKVNYKYLGNPKIQNKKMWADDWALGYTEPLEQIDLIDYKTGKAFSDKNKQGVKLTSSKWKYTYYPKQHYKQYDCDKKKFVDETLSFTKTSSISFSVTYPKKYKDVVVGIGFVNTIYSLSENEQSADYFFYERKVPYGKTTYYKCGRGTMSYMRLNK